MIFPLFSAWQIPFHIQNLVHSFLTVTQKREQLPSLSQSIPATLVLSVKRGQNTGSQASLWFHPVSKTPEEMLLFILGRIVKLQWEALPFS